MEKWHSDPQYQRIGDIMVKNAPFLKMYTEYVKNFDTAMNTMNTLYNKNSKFSAIVDDIHVSDQIQGPLRSKELLRQFWGFGTK